MKIQAELKRLISEHVYTFMRENLLAIFAIIIARSVLNNSKYRSVLLA